MRSDKTQQSPAQREHPVLRFRRFDGLTPTSPMSSLTLHSLEVDGDMPVEELDRLLGDHPEAPGVLVSRAGRLLGVLPRRRLLERLSSRYGRDLHSRRPVAQLLPAIQAQPLVVPANERIELAAQAALLRPSDEFADPLVVAFPDGRHALADFHEVLLAQTRILELANARNASLLAEVEHGAGKLQQLLEEQRQTHARMSDDLQARQRAEELQLANQRRLVRQTSALQEISKLDSVRDSDFDIAIGDIVQIVALTLKIGRAAVWLFEDGPAGREMVEAVHYDPDHLGSGQPASRFPLSRFPRYITAILRDRLLAVADIEDDVRIAELVDPFLEPAGITSLLHVALQVQDRQIGILCCGHRHGRRGWANDEINFIEAVGNLISLLSVGQERNLAVQARLESEARLERMLANSPVAICMFDTDGTILLTNSSLGRLFQDDAEALKGTRVQDLYDDPAQHDGFMDAFTRDGRLQSVEVGFRIEGDGVRWTIMSWEPSQFNGRRAIVAWLFDVTTQKEAEEKLRLAKEQAEANTRAKSTFLATMSHEIRTPMNGVLGMLDLVKRTNLSGEQARMLSIIEESALSLLYIIDDILDFSKIEAGRLDIEMLPLSIPETVEGVALTMAPAARRKGLRFLCDVDPEIPPLLMADPVRLRQILFNLVGNAIKFTHEGVVALRVGLERGSDDRPLLRFTVRDTGIGLSPDQVDRLFQPFTQADGSTSRRFGGTGLGLAICRMLAKLMDGQIGVDSVLGQGSTFWLTLDVRRPATDADLETARKGGRPIPLDGVRVLLALDHEDEEATVERYLEADGAQVELISGLPELVRRAETLEAAGHDVVAVVEGGADAAPIGDLPHVRLHDEEKPPRRLVLNRAVAVAAGLARDDRPLRTQTVCEGFVAPEDPILVVDDHPINREVISRQLEQLGCATITASSGHEALAEFMRGRFALVLTDCEMPEMDGMALARAIRAHELEEGLERAPIVALTANALGDQTEKCLAAGMDDCLIKPIDTIRLGTALKRWLPDSPVGRAGAFVGSPGAFPGDPADGHVPLVAMPHVAIPELRNLAPPPPRKPAERPAPVPAATEGEPAFSMAPLVDLVGDDRDAIRALILRWRSSTQPAYAALGDAMAGDADAETVRALAHKIKGGSAMVGAHPLAATCLALEEAARKGDNERFADLFRAVQSRWDEAMTFVDGF